MDTVLDRVCWNHPTSCPAFISTDLARFLVMFLHGVFRLYDARMAKLILECARGIITIILAALSKHHVERGIPSSVLLGLPEETSNENPPFGIRRNKSPPA